MRTNNSSHRRVESLQDKCSIYLPIVWDANAEKSPTLHWNGKQYCNNYVPVVAIHATSPWQLNYSGWYPGQTFCSRLFFGARLPFPPYASVQHFRIFERCPYSGVCAAYGRQPLTTKVRNTKLKKCLLDCLVQVVFVFPALSLFSFSLFFYKTLSPHFVGLCNVLPSFVSMTKLSLLSCAFLCVRRIFCMYYIVYWAWWQCTMYELAV